AQTRRRAWYTEVEKVQAGQAHNGTGDSEREEGDHRRQRIGQDVLADDSPIAYAHGTRGLDIVKVPGTQEFGPHIGTQTHPTKDAQEGQEQRDAGLERGGENDQYIELWEGTPDLDAALSQEIKPPSEKALHGPDENPQGGPQAGQNQPKEDRDAEPVDQPGEH